MALLHRKRGRISARVSRLRVRNNTYMGGEKHVLISVQEGKTRIIILINICKIFIKIMVKMRNTSSYWAK